MRDRRGDLARAVAAVEAGAEIAMRFFRKDHERWEKAPGSLVTEADIAIDRELRRTLPQGDEGWISEETTDDGTRAARSWIVDPIDGTSAFAEGRPEFMVSVALLEDGRPVVGALAVPATGEVYSAAVGGGAHHGERRLVVDAPKLGQGVVAISPRERRRAALLEDIPGAEVTHLGSLAHRLALVAAGRFSATLTLRRCHDWDIAAAAVILAEAGVRFTDARGEPLRYGSATLQQPTLLAAVPSVHADLVAAIAPHLPV